MKIYKNRNATSEIFLTHCGIEFGQKFASHPPCIPPALIQGAVDTRVLGATTEAYKALDCKRF